MNIEKLDGSKLVPIFYSEISSSYMIFDIFKNNIKIANDFIKNFIGITIDSDFVICREKNFIGKGSIDIYFKFKSNNKIICILLEVKVHDYLSATPNQIITYYNAALEEKIYDEIYFIYLTQFNANNFKITDEVLLPPTIDEFNRTISSLTKYKNKFIHINWLGFHVFINNYKTYLTSEQQLILNLQKLWIDDKNKSDIKNNNINVGTRNLSDYFKDIDYDLIKELNFGTIKPKNKRKILSINLSTCSKDNLDKIIKVIKSLCSSSSIAKQINKKTNDQTLIGAQEFLTNLATDETNWLLLSFYSELFHFINNTDYILFNGTGRIGFSIKVNIISKSEISLCTLRCNKTIEFCLLR
jgi:hypothetical protein